MRVIVQDGWHQTLPANSAAQHVTVAAGHVSDGGVFGVQRNAATVQGIVFNDLNGDGHRQDGEGGVGGWSVYLDLNHDGRHEDGEPLATTGDGGAYTFAHVTPREYQVRLIGHDGWTQTAPPSGGAQVVHPQPGQTVAGVNFGVHQNPVAGAIAGTVFNDVNGNGTRDSGDEGLAGQSVYIDLNNDNKREDGEPLTHSIAGGAYSFSNVPVGTYNVRLLPQDGWRQTLPASAAARVVTVAAGKTTDSAVFGVQHIPPAPAPATLQGSVFNEVNGDGHHEDGEAGLAGWSVYIDVNGDGKHEDGEKLVVTDGGGHYKIDGLAAGTYTLRPIPQDGWHQSAPANNAGRTITVAAGQNADGILFGVTKNV